MNDADPASVVASKRYELLLVVGFVSFSIALLSAHLNPATGYEVSIYGALHGVGGTPFLYWIAVGLALTVSVIVAFAAPENHVRSIGYGLGVLSFMSVVMLPLIRGWHYHGGSDALSHLGGTREFAYGVNVITNSQYPFLHTATVFISGVTGVELNRTFLMVVPSFVLIFVLFSALTARLFSNDRWVLGAGVFSGMLLLPINHISGDLTPQPSSQAMLYVTFALFLLVFVMTERDRRASVLLILVTLTVVMLHPLHAASLILLLVTIGGVQLLHSSFRRSKSFLPKMPVYLQASLLVLFFWVWVQAIIAERFERNFSRMIGSMFVDTETAGTVQSRTLSLEALGGSLEEMFLKMFLVSAVFCVICAILMGASVTTAFFGWSRRLRSLARPISFQSPVANAVLGYWTLGFTAASVLFLIYLFGGISDQYMRHYGFLMASVTIIGAIAVGQILKLLSDRFSVGKAKPIAIVFVVACLLMTLPVAFSSPYIYQDSHHISEESMEGHTTAFEITDEEALHTSVRRGVHRYQDALLRGYDTDRSYEEDYVTDSVPNHFANDEIGANETENQRDLHGFYDDPAYLYVKEKDRDFETKVLDGLRWSEEDFAYLEQEPGINRVQDNGGFTLYAVENRESPNDPSTLQDG